MGHRRIGASTIILVVALLAALVGIGHVVTPPPEGPPPPPKPVQVAKPTTAGMTAKERIQAIQGAPARQLTPSKKPGKPMPYLPDPNTIQVTPQYFRDVDPGPNGVAQEAAVVAAKKRKYAAYVAQMRASGQKKSLPALPANRPTSTGASTGTLGK